MYKNIVKNMTLFSVLVLACTSPLQAQALKCPEEGQEIYANDLSPQELDFYNKSCYLKPDEQTGLLKPYALKRIAMPQVSRKVAFRAPGVNEVAVAG